MTSRIRRAAKKSRVIFLTYTLYTHTTHIYTHTHTVAPRHAKPRKAQLYKKRLASSSSSSSVFRENVKRASLTLGTFGERRTVSLAAVCMRVRGIEDPFDLSSEKTSRARDLLPLILAQCDSLPVCTLRSPVFLSSLAWVFLCV